MQSTGNSIDEISYDEHKKPDTKRVYNVAIYWFKLLVYFIHLNFNFLNIFKICIYNKIQTKQK